MSSVGYVLRLWHFLLVSFVGYVPCLRLPHTGIGRLFSVIVAVSIGVIGRVCSSIVALSLGVIGRLCSMFTALSSYWHW